ncbi:MAG: sodium:calcium antiporter, partial [Actinomycetota bacterium]
GQLAREIARTALGLAVVLVSAERLVWGAERIAREFGVSETTIGLTLVAIGTSLPEVVTGVIAARRGEPDLVLGNVLGSNLFNALLVVGSAGAVGPLAMVGASRAIALVGLAATTLLLAVFLLPGYRITRRQAVAWLAGYAAFVAALFVVR